MQRWFRAAILAFAVLAIVGCSENSGPTPKPRTNASVGRPKPPPPPPPPPPPATAVTGESPLQRPAAMPQSPTTTQPAAPTTAPSPLPSAPVTAQNSIQLATGVALAQTGLDGTMMMFSVDYEVAQGQPDTSGYIWVIERTHGPAAKVEVKLTAKGNLMTKLPADWRPENGPFRSHLEDRQGHRVSESIEMLEPGT
jgi:hypothetical protein